MGGQSVLADTADDPGLVLAVRPLQTPALIKPLAFVGREVAIKAGEADCGDGPPVTLFNAFQTYFQLLHEAVAARPRFGAGGPALVQYGRVEILRHAVDVAVAPVTLQGIEMLLGTLQEAVCVKPVRCPHGDRRRCHWLGSRCMAGPVLLVRPARGATGGVGLALHGGCAAATEQLEQHKGDQAENQDVEQLQTLESVTEQHGGQQTTGSDTGQRAEPAAGARGGSGVLLLVTRVGLLLLRGLPLSRLALVHRGSAETLAAAHATGLGIGYGKADHEENGEKG